MACVNPDGTLTASAVTILKALPATAQEIAQKTGLPLFRIRSGLRDMVTEQLVENRGDTFHATDNAARFTK